MPSPLLFSALSCLADSLSNMLRNQKVLLKKPARELNKHGGVPTLECQPGSPDLLTKPGIRAFRFTPAAESSINLCKSIGLILKNDFATQRINAGVRHPQNVGCCRSRRQTVCHQIRRTSTHQISLRRLNDGSRQMPFTS